MNYLLLHQRQRRRERERERERDVVARTRHLTSISLRNPSRRLSVIYAAASGAETIHQNHPPDRAVSFRFATRNVDDLVDDDVGPGDRRRRDAQVGDTGQQRRPNIDDDVDDKKKQNKRKPLPAIDRRRRRRRRRRRADANRRRRCLMTSIACNATPISCHQRHRPTTDDDDGLEEKKKEKKREKKTDAQRFFIASSVATPASEKRSTYF